MKTRRRIVSFALVLLAILSLSLTACGSESAPANETVVLKLKNTEFTESQILAMMEYTAKSYKMTLDDVKEDVVIWNSLVDGVVYNYAAAEISRDLCREYGIDEISEEEQQQIDDFYDQFISTIKSIGEKPSKYLAKLGLTEETLRAYAEDQVYKTHLSSYWAEDGASEYEELLNFTKKIWEEVDKRKADGIYSIDESTLLIEEEGK